MSSTQQKFLYGEDCEMEERINKHLKAGWRIVPQTLCFHNEEFVDSGYARTPNKTRFRVVMAVVMEKPAE